MNKPIEAWWRIYIQVMPAACLTANSETASYFRIDPTQHPNINCFVYFFGPSKRMGNSNWKHRNVKIGDWEFRESNDAVAWTHGQHFRVTICTKVCLWVLNDYKVSLGPGNGLVPNKRHVITWNNDDPVHWRKCASPGLIELMRKRGSCQTVLHRTSSPSIR